MPSISVARGEQIIAKKEQGRAVGNAAPPAGILQKVKLNYFSNLFDMTAPLEPRIRNARDGGFQQALRLGQRVIQPRTLIQFIFVELFLLHQFFRRFTAFVAQQIDLKRQQSCTPQRQRHFGFFSFHQSTMTGWPRRESLLAEYRAPLELFLTNRSNRSAARTSNPLAGTIGTSLASADSHFTDSVLLVFTCPHSTGFRAAVLTSFARHRTFFAKFSRSLSGVLRYLPNVSNNFTISSEANETVRKLMRRNAVRFLPH